MLVESTVICRPGTLRYERVHKGWRYEEISFSDTYFQSWNVMSCMRDGGYGFRLWNGILASVTFSCKCTALRDNINLYEAWSGQRLLDWLAYISEVLPNLWPPSLSYLNEIYWPRTYMLNLCFKITHWFFMHFHTFFVHVLMSCK